MGTRTSFVRGLQISSSEPGVASGASDDPRTWAPLLITVPHAAALRAFAGGFMSSLIGGLVYTLILSYFEPDGLRLALLRALALSLTFGAFEAWRVRRPRTPEMIRTRMLWTLTACLLVFLALGAAMPATDSFLPETPLPAYHVRLDRLV